MPTNQPAQAETLTEHREQNRDQRGGQGRVAARQVGRNGQGERQRQRAPHATPDQDVAGGPGQAFAHSGGDGADGID